MGVSAHGHCYLRGNSFLLVLVSRHEEREIHVPGDGSVHGELPPQVRVGLQLLSPPHGGAGLCRQRLGISTAWVQRVGLFLRLEGGAIHGSGSQREMEDGNLGCR